MAHKRRKGKVSGKRKAKTSSVVVNPLEFTNLKSDDLAILSVYIEILGSIIGLWSLYLARLEDAESAGINPEEIPLLPFGAVRRVTERKRSKKKKRK